VPTVDAMGNVSLRSAIQQGNYEAINGKAIVIHFQAGLTGTITLGTGLGILQNRFEINGPGSTVITVAVPTPLPSSATPSTGVFF